MLRQRETAITGRSDLRVRCLTPEQAESFARNGTPRLWIFCSTVELSKVVYLACSIRRYCPESRLLLLRASRAPGFEDSLFHGILSASETVEVFLDVVSSLAMAA